MSPQNTDSNEQKLEAAKNKANIANQERYQQIKDSIRLFRTQSEQRIANYEKQITELKNANKKKANSEYEKALAELEQKNSEMRKRLSDFNDENQKSWESFKSEFNHDMEKIGKAFKDITVNNVK
jgi:NADH/NAD ratio-sensing transcriptional regulator Rex